MKLYKSSEGFDLILTKEELKSLHNMIDSAQLPERRVFNNIKEQIKEILNEKGF